MCAQTIFGKGGPIFTANFWSRPIFTPDQVFRDRTFGLASSPGLQSQLTTASAVIEGLGTRLPLDMTSLQYAPPEHLIRHEEYRQPMGLQFWLQVGNLFGRQAVNDSTLAPVSYTVFIPALTQP